MAEQAPILHEQWVTVDGVRVFSHVGTSASSVGAMPIVLVHGYGAASGYLLPTAEHLAPHHPVYVPDLPGWGKSDEPDHALDLAELADVLAGFIRVQQLSPVVLLGNSFGCQIIVEFVGAVPGSGASGGIGRTNTRSGDAIGCPARLAIGEDHGARASDATPDCRAGLPSIRNP